MGSGYDLGLQSAQLKSYGVSIDGEALTNSQTVHLKVKYDISSFKITGELLFKDLSSLVERLPIRGGNTVSLSMTDFDKVPNLEHGLTVVDVQYTRDQDGAILTKLILIDPITVTAMQMYNEMSWSSANMIEIIDHVETLKPSLVGKKKNFCPPPPPHSNFCLPLHVSFNSVMHWLARNNNKMFYQTRTEFVIQPIEKIQAKPKKGDKFRYKTPNPNYRRRIFEFNASIGKEFAATAFQPTGKIASQVPSFKHAKWASNSFSSAREKVNGKGNYPEPMASTGAKHYYKTDNHVQLLVDHLWEKNAIGDLELEILVPGQFATNIGDIVEVKMDNYTYHDKPEFNLNGLWLITKLVDVVRPPDFIQRITLSRTKYTKQVNKE